MKIIRFHFHNGIKRPAGLPEPCTYGQCLMEFHYTHHRETVMNGIAVYKRISIVEYRRHSYIRRQSIRIQCYPFLQTADIYGI